jgi:hypothetical protein
MLHFVQMKLPAANDVALRANDVVLRTNDVAPLGAQIKGKNPRAVPYGDNFICTY